MSYMCLQMSFLSFLLFSPSRNWQRLRWESFPTLVSLKQLFYIRDSSTKCTSVHEFNAMFETWCFSVAAFYEAAALEKVWEMKNW